MENVEIEAPMQWMHVSVDGECVYDTFPCPDYCTHSAILSIAPGREWLDMYVRL